MCSGLPLHSSHDLRILKSRYPCTGQSKLFEFKRRPQLTFFLSSRASLQDNWNLSISTQIYQPCYSVARRAQRFTCYSFMHPGWTANNAILKLTGSIFTRSYNALQGFPLLPQLLPAVGVIVFTIWGLGPLLRHIRNFLMHRNDPNWKRSRTYYIFYSYLQPMFLWVGITLICRVVDPISLPSDASNAVKQRVLTFFRSLSTVLALAYCFSSLIQQAQKLFTDKSESNDARTMGIQFASRTVNTAVWIAASSLFMELLGFSTQKWLTAGGLGTVLLTLAGREIFTNFLSSVMIHATRPFVINDWIQTKIEGYEVSGTVEHVGWWSPTVIRGDDREAIHIPNHKFTVNVVRNLTQKAHWRIKTHLAISHLDANKISNIVADMRKVLAKNPQVEQQRVHRRVFLDYINPENQALMILISCFVKTSHFEEYLGVKEAVILDLLRVISHHRARLATPIRTVQKMYDTDLDNIPFADPVFTRGRGPINRPLYLIETKMKVNGDRGRMGARSNEEPLSRMAITLDENEISSVHEETDTGSSLHHREESLGDAPRPSGSSSEDKQRKAKSGDDRPKNDTSELRKPVADAKLVGDAKPAGDAPDRPKNDMSEIRKPVVEAKPVGDATSKVPVNRKDLAGSNSKENAHSAAESPVMRPSLEENIVLGVALDGAKRTLPIEEGIGMPPAAETKELASVRSGNGSPLPAKDKNDGQGPVMPSKSSSTTAGQKGPSPAPGQRDKGPSPAPGQRD